MRNSFSFLRRVLGTRRYRRPKGRGTTKPVLGHFEPLESRCLLATTPLATLPGSVAAGTDSELALAVADAQTSVVLSLMVEADGGSTLDPLAPRLADAQGNPVAPLGSRDDYDGTTGGMATFELANGDYTVFVGGAGSTAGNFVIEVGMPGDTGHDGGVSQYELQWTAAALVQQQGWANYVSARLFRTMGIDPSIDLFRYELDANGNGIVDPIDLDLVARNRGSGTVTVELTGDSDAPSIDAAVTPDTGRFADDGITNDPDAKIVGTISDDGDITAFTVQVNGSAAEDLFTLLGQDFNANGAFELTLDQLATIAGLTRADLIDSGQHTVTFSARDQYGNETTSPVEVRFEIDTIPPDPPSTPDLTDESDSGTSNTDNLTNLATPTFTVDAESKSLVQLFSDLVTGPLGQETAASEVDITSSTLADNVHQITARATDLAGNTGDLSAALQVVVDTLPPDPVPDFDLAEESDTGTQDDHLTTETQVTLEGTTEPGATVTLDGTSISGVAAGDGSFTLTGVTLSFGYNPYTVVATDTAGNASRTTQYFSRNDAPEVNDQQFVVDENSPVGTPVDTVAANDVNLTENDSLTFKITGGTGQNYFAINDNTGEITVADPAGLDRETVPSHTVLVRVTDAGGDGQGGAGLSDDATITINLNDQNDVAPVVDSAQAETIAENTVSTTEVLIVTATDGDVTQPTVFQNWLITGGNTDTDGDNQPAFVMDPSSGQITVNDQDDLDYEQTPVFTLQVTVSDGVQTSAAEDVVINLSDVNEPPVVPDGQEFHVRPGMGTQTAGPINANDPENPQGQTLTFELVNVSPDTDKFSVRPNDGVITAETDQLQDGDDYRLTVNVSDGFNEPVVAQIVVHVRVNRAPEAKPDTMNVKENEADTKRVLLNDTDPDPDDDPNNFSLDTIDSVVVSGLSAGTSLSTGSATESATQEGLIQFNPGTDFDELDFGDVATVIVTYTMSDDSGFPSSSTLTITVTGVNDGPNANFDTESTGENTPVSKNVLTNDTDVDGDDHPGNFTLKTIDSVVVDGLSTGNSLITGSATESATEEGVIEFDPGTDFDELDDGDSATVTISYTMADDSGRSSQGTYTITVTGSNDAPVAIADIDSTGENFPISKNVLANDSDVDGDDNSTNFTLVSIDSVVVSGLSTGARLLSGSVTGNTAGLIELHPGNDFDELKNDEEAIVTIGYTMSDDSGATASGTFTITVEGSDDVLSFETIPTLEMRAGSPLHVALDALGADGEALDYTVIGNTNRGLVQTSFPEKDSRSMRIVMQGFGDTARENGVMIFRLFDKRLDDRVEDLTDHIAQLAEDGAYNGTTFHRVRKDFMIQTGIPPAEYTGPTPLVADQFHPEAQHNATGYLSLAKPGDQNPLTGYPPWPGVGDDYGSTSFFITDFAGLNTVSEEDLRNLDFNHPVFGFQTEGEAVRQRISDVPVEKQSTTNPEVSKPKTPVVIDHVDIFTDTQNEVLMLSAAERTSGSAQITVQVKDSQGRQYNQTFNVNVSELDYDGRPYLQDIDAEKEEGINVMRTPINTDLVFQLEAIDVEAFNRSLQPDVEYFGGMSSEGTALGATLTVTDTGQVTVRSPNAGSFHIYVRVGPDGSTNEGTVLTTPYDTQVIKVIVEPLL
jgi:cyclophilin family peptidyl-prolyl cis-trans isomerase